MKVVQAACYEILGELSGEVKKNYVLGIVNGATIWIPGFNKCGGKSQIAVHFLKGIVNCYSTRPFLRERNSLMQSWANELE